MDQNHERSVLTAVELPEVRFFSRTLLLCVYLPLLHLAFATLVGDPPVNRPAGVNIILPLVMIWSFTGSIALLLPLLERGLVPTDGGLNTGQFIAKYFSVSLVCLLVLGLFYANINALPNIEENRQPLGLFMILTIEVLLFAVIRSVLQQQQLDHAVKMNLRAAQYQTLRAQLKPHFLFNSLNLISSEIENDPKLAVELLDKLSELLRAALNATEKPLISLGDELNLLELYLEIQQHRFGERLQYNIERCEAHRKYLLPPMLLQPLVENAIKHGIAPHKSGGTVSVRTGIEAGQMKISIHDNGSGFDQKKTKIGHGLQLVRDSVELLYAPEIEQGNSAFAVHSVPEEGTTVTLRLPGTR
jgi:signal transduction histidine kinase